MRIVTTNKLLVSEVVQVLKEGGLIVAPTDTVYGLLVDATNEQAVKKLIQLKNRPIGKPISVFVSSLSMLHEYVFAEGGNNLEALLPGSYTVVLPSKHKVSRLLESESGTLGVRYIDNEFITNLVAQFGSPVTATSANLAGKPPHYSVQSFLASLPKSKEHLIDLVIDGGKLPHRLPSTVLDLSTPNPQVLRQGDNTMGKVKWQMANKSHTKSAVETASLAKEILDQVMTINSNKPIVFLLHGDLGAGKTTFTKAIAAEFNISRVDSPTYTIASEYEIEMEKDDGKVSRLVHYDLYNIANEEELYELRIAEQLPGSITIIEWAEKLGDEKQKLKQHADIIEVYLEYVDENKRMISWIYMS